WDRRVDGEEVRPHRGVDRPHEVGPLHLRQRGSLHVADRDQVEGNVEPPRVLDDRLHEVPDRRFVQRVDLEPARHPADGAALGRQRLGLRRGAVADEHPRALGAERPRHRSSDRPRPVDRRNLPVQQHPDLLVGSFSPPGTVPESPTHRRYCPRMELLDSKLVYEGYGVDVEIRRYRRIDGTEVERQVIDHPGSVAILAHDEEFVYLVAQPREAVEEDALLEIPAGTLDKAGESELECARRELAEEAWLAATEWTELTKIYPSPGYISEEVTIFLATGLSPARGERDEDEAIDIVRLPLAEIAAELPRIRDASTLIALMALRYRLAPTA